MAEDVDLLIAEGNDAVRSGRWAQAREAFEGALAGGDPHPVALYGLGEALWWLGDVQDAIRTVERAYSEFRRREDHERAAIAAMQLCGAHRSNFANLAASAGWFARAERLVEQFDLQALLGWLALTRAGDARDPAAAERSARDALTIARRDRDLDLELCALSQIGFALVGQGRFADGLSMLDEAMAASLAGEGMRLDKPGPSARMRAGRTARPEPRNRDRRSQQAPRPRGSHRPPVAGHHDRPTGRRP